MLNENCENMAQTCIGCMSSNRTLSKLTQKYINLYYDLLEKESSIKIECKFSDMQLCWECTGVLSKIVKFQSQLYQAYMQHNIDYKMAMVNCFSSLMICKQTQIIYFVNEESLYAVGKDEDSLLSSPGRDIDDSDHKNFIEISVSELETSNKEQLLHEKTAQESKLIHKRKNIYENFKKLTNFSIYFNKITINRQQLLQMLIKKNAYQCSLCLHSFTNEDMLNKHLKLFHKESDGKYQCDACLKCFSDYGNLQNHVAGQSCILHRCKICNFNCIGKILQRDHLLNTHSIKFICKICQHHFGKRVEFRNHYKALHTCLICDYCGKNFLKRSGIERHMKRNHSSLVCTICTRKYDRYHSLQNHYRMCHPHVILKNIKIEDSYCVECDKQFTSAYKYKNHLRTSVRHTTPKKVCVPCPVCSKVFTRKTYMNNHYKLAHVKKSQHYCQECDKYYFNAYTLRQHKLAVHEKVEPAKNKMCKVCGKGFSTNRALTYHVRTHTGERPYVCHHCLATFPRKKSMILHIKAIHMKNLYDVLEKT